MLRRNGKNTLRFSFLVAILLAHLNGLGQENKPASDSTGMVTINEFITMEDGIRLATDIYLPSDSGKFPTILARTPYNKKHIKQVAALAMANGYALIAQDCRGKFLSEGEFYPFKNERSDGLTTVRWILDQPWSNGKIGGWGGSYVGYTQWAISDVLDVITPELTSADIFGLFYPGGMFSLATAFNWGFVVDAQRINPVAPEKILESYTILPLSFADDSTTKDIIYINDWLRHSSYDEYWKSQNHRAIASAAVFSIAGWYDIFLMPQIVDFQSLDQTIKEKSRFIIGPWCHGSQAFKNDYGGSEKKGPKIKWMAGFFSKYLKEEDFDFTDTVFKNKIYNLFVMERNEYYGCDIWPPKATVLTEFYLEPDHYFSSEISNKQGRLNYTYNPADPYPNKGGTFLGVGVGAALQNENESRPDQLMFETEILESPLILLGPISATLYVSSDVPSTDFIVCVQDVFPDGNIINIQEGGAKVNINEGINKIDISVWATGYQLNQGHKLRAVITSSWFPRFNRNLNTGEPVFSAKKIKTAHHSVYFGKNPSSVTLPILKIKDDKFMDE